MSELHAASSSPRRHLAVGAIADQGRRRRLGCGLRLLAGVLAAAPLSPAAAPDAASDAALAGRSAAAPSVITEPRGRAAPAATIVSTTGQLRKAVAAARPGEVILIAPGVYQTIVRFAPGNSGAVEAPVVLGARDGLGTVVIDGDGANITVKLSGAAYVEIRDLEITGGGFHGVFLDRGAHHITIRHNRIYDNHRVRPLNSHAEIKGSGGEGRPFEVAIVDNEIFHRTHPPGGNFHSDQEPIHGNDHLAQPHRAVPYRHRVRRRRPREPGAPGRDHRKQLDPRQCRDGDRDRRRPRR